VALRTCRQKTDVDRATAAIESRQPRTRVSENAVLQEPSAGGGIACAGSVAQQDGDGGSRVRRRRGRFWTDTDAMRLRAASHGTQQRVPPARTDERGGVDVWLRDRSTRGNDCSCVQLLQYVGGPKVQIFGGVGEG
jgi:hypothetical protein